MYIDPIKCKTFEGRNALRMREVIGELLGDVNHGEQNSIRNLHFMHIYYLCSYAFYQKKKK